MHKKHLVELTPYGSLESDGKGRVGVGFVNGVAYHNERAR